MVFQVSYFYVGLPKGRSNSLREFSNMFVIFFIIQPESIIDDDSIMRPTSQLALSGVCYRAMRRSFWSATATARRGEPNKFFQVIQKKFVLT